MKFLTLTAILIASTSVYASECKLKYERPIKIACNDSCGVLLKTRMNIAALLSGYSLEFINLNNNLNLVDSADAIIITDGPDISSRVYMDLLDNQGKQRVEKYQSHFRSSSDGELRDLFESTFIRNYYNNEKFKYIPLLGIGRGMQMMGAALGVALHQDVEAELNISNREFLYDKVSMPKGDTLANQIFGGGQFLGAKNHHQSINISYFNNKHEQFHNAVLTGFSHDKSIAEIIEYRHRIAIGFQSLPEFSLYDKIFSWFLMNTCKKINN